VPIIKSAGVLHFGSELRHHDPKEAEYWIDFQVPLDELKHPQTNNPLGDPEKQFLSEVRLAALRYARDVIGDETQRLSKLAGRIR
jgi:hypothetical protein